MSKSECDNGECTATPRAERKKRRQKKSKRLTLRLVPRREPDGQSDDKDENNEGYEGDKAAPRPLLFSLAHVSDQFSSLFNSFCGLPLGRCTKGNTEDDGPKDPENGEHCQRARESRSGGSACEMMRLTKAVLEHVHGKGGWFFWSGFLVPGRVSGELFTVVVGGRGSIVPRFASASNTAGSSGGNSEEVIKRIDFILLEGLVRGMGGSLWRWSGKLDGHTSAGDDGGRSCLGSSGGRDKIPGTGDSAGGTGGGLSEDGGGDESDGRHFVEFGEVIGGEEEGSYLS